MHGGRGVWCCATVSPTVLLTGGGDSALRLWRLPFWLKASTAELLTQQLDSQLAGSVLREFNENAGPKASASALSKCDNEQAGHLLQLPAATECTHSAPDSVRGMEFASLQRLYVITKAGHLHCAALTPPQTHASASNGADAFAWHSLWSAPACDAPLNCFSIVPGEECDLVVIGDQAGFVTVLRVPHASAEAQGQSAQCLGRAQLAGGAPVLGVYGLREVPCGQLLVSSTHNVMHWVAIPGLSSSGSALTTAEAVCPAAVAPELLDSRQRTTQLDSERVPALQVLARCCTGRQPRIVSAALMVASDMLIVGDVSGGVCAFAIPSYLRRCSASGWVDLARSSSTTEGSGHSKGVAEMAPQAAQAGAAVVSTSAVTELQMVAKLGSCHGNTPVTMIRCLCDRVYTGGRNGAPRSLRCSRQRTAVLLTVVTAPIASQTYMPVSLLHASKSCRSSVLGACSRVVVTCRSGAPMQDVLHRLKRDPAPTRSTRKTELAAGPQPRSIALATKSTRRSLASWTLLRPAMEMMWRRVTPSLLGSGCAHYPSK